MDEAAAYRVLEQARWGGPPPACPHCGVPGRCYFLAPRDGAGRATRTGARTGRRVWKCGSCRGQFSVLTGTALEGTRIPVAAWVGVLGDVVDSCPPAPELGRRHGVAASTVRSMLRRSDAAGRDPDPLTALLRARPGERRGAVVPGGRAVGPSADYD